MEWWKILSLVIAGLYIIGAILSFSGDNSGTKTSPEDPLKRVFSMFVGMSLWLSVSLGCIWYGDELGEGLIGAKFGLISRVSPGWLVAFMGWVLLLAPALLVVIF